MAQNVVNGSSKRKHIREPPTVPFLWEDRPGVAKKDWRPAVSSVTTLALPSPVKLIASVPFIWEEKPGKPLSSFSEPSMESSPATPSVSLMALPSPPMYSQWHNEQSFNNEGGHDEKYGKEDGLFNLDLQSFNFETDESFSSAHSLSANCLVSTLAISAAVPVLETSSRDINGQFETPSSPASETDSSTSSYATGISSLAGSSFLECLFPLYARNSSFPGDVACNEESYLSLPEEKIDNFNPRNDDDVMARRPVTLGELIKMSRRMSCQRKAVQMAKQNLSMEFINKKAFGCCIFGAGMNMLERLQRKRQHLLKLL